MHSNDIVLQQMRELVLSMARPVAETLQAWMRSTAQLAGCSHSQKVGKVQRYKIKTLKLGKVL